MFVWQLIITGKMPVARVEKMSIFGIRQLINCMVLANAILLRRALQNLVLQRFRQAQQKLRQARQRRLLLRNNLKIIYDFI